MAVAVALARAVAVMTAAVATAVVAAAKVGSGGSGDGGHCDSVAVLRSVAEAVAVAVDFSLSSS